MKARATRLAAAGVVTGAVLAATAIAAGQQAVAVDGAAFFARTSTYPVFQNLPPGEDPAQETLAEISAVSRDGRTLVYTDAAGKRIGFLDITNAYRPKGLGTLSLAQLGDADDEPTSVAVVGPYVLVVVNTSPSFTAPSGRLDVIRLSDRTRVRSIDLGGQPDAVTVSANGRYAAIAMENQRDEDATPTGGDEGDLPQLPAGFVQIVDLVGAPAAWTTRKVALTAADGSALPLLSAAGIFEPTDPEPEYVSINAANQLAVTLQENNAVVLIDLATGTPVRAFSAGTATVTGIDTEDDGTIDRTGSIVDLPREPDALAWIDNRYLATANEGDLTGGTRGWTVFDSTTGAVAWDSGNTLENLAIATGLHNEGRADNKGVEPEGIAVATINGVRYGFVGSERSNFVAVYDLSNPVAPVYRQILPTTNGPEGLLAIPSRGLLAVSSEVDDSSALVRATVGLYKFGAAAPFWPQVTSSSTTDPIGWGALSGLSAVPGRPGELVAVTDAAYSPTQVLTIDTTTKPARITSSLTVKDAAGAPLGVDAEGVYARPQGGYWLAVEGRTGPQNQLLRLDATGTVQQSIPLPAEIGAVTRSQGFEGVSASTDAAGEHVFVVIQRELTSDPAGVARIGRYDVATGDWTWFGYPLGTTSIPGDWIGLSEVTVLDSRTLAVIERDKQNGTTARVKKVYTVRLPATDPAPGTVPVLSKTQLRDVLPALRSTNGWTQEKLEGFTLGGNGRFYAVTDNDGVDDATGETVFLDLGPYRRG